ncbi:MAG: hypothetical protein Q4D85_08765 [Corynebacterium sp.]|uniref:hypothetical protein n=1 Tax=Corynebacterium sp. TaxID=1720 RepID=UPI0026DC0EEB|nr:hypothetical protein [Corynebacterium sp.]MDO5098838.1 hypothetical protein [Corynebacterium sp.]
MHEDNPPTTAPPTAAGRDLTAGFPAGTAVSLPKRRDRDRVFARRIVGCARITKVGYSGHICCEFLSKITT